MDVVNSPRPIPRSRRGVSAIMTLLMLVALTGLVSMGVDIGRVQVAKTELQTAADAAARTAAGELGSGVTTARAAAVAVAGANNCDGSPVVLEPAADVEFGTWDAAARTFTPLAGAAQSNANAVRVTARRTRARNNAIPLVFAKALGKPTCDVRATAVALFTRGTATHALVGLDFITLGGGAYIDSYVSAGGLYSAATARSNGSIASNGDISLSGNGAVRGDARPGIGRTVSSSGSTIITGSTTPLDYALVYPAPSPGNAATVNDNGSLPAAYFNPATRNLALPNSGTVTLQAGVYYVNNVTTSGSVNLHIAGPVTMYITGSFSMGNNLTVAQNLPADFKLRSLGSAPINFNSNGQIYADVYAPASPVTISGGGHVYGTVVGRTVSLSGNGGFHYDESLAVSTTGGGNRVSLVK